MDFVIFGVGFGAGLVIGNDYLRGKTWAWLAAAAGGAWLALGDWLSGLSLPLF